MHFLRSPYVCYCLISLIFTILVVVLFSLVFYLLQPVAQNFLKNIDAILSYYWEIPVFIMFWIKFCTMVKHSAVTSVLEVSGALTTDLDLDRVRLTLLSLICQQNDSFGSWLSNGFLEGAVRINPNSIIAVFFFPKSLFNYAIEEKFITWRVNSMLNCTWKPILHSSLHDLCDIRFHVQFNAEFPRQLMNFSIE